MTRGRPSFLPTKAQRERASILSAARMSEADIALAFGISRPTLRKHFAKELTVGAAQRNAAMLEQLYRTGIEGNVSAQKAWLARQPSPEGSLETLGKKQIADAEAHKPPTGEWEGLVAH